MQSRACRLAFLMTLKLMAHIPYSQSVAQLSCQNVSEPLPVTTPRASGQLPPPPSGVCCAPATLPLQVTLYFAARASCPVPDPGVSLPCLNPPQLPVLQAGTPASSHGPGDPASSGLLDACDHSWSTSHWPSFCPFRRHARRASSLPRPVLLIIQVLDSWDESAPQCLPCSSFPEGSCHVCPFTCSAPVCSPWSMSCLRAGLCLSCFLWTTQHPMQCLAHGKCSEGFLGMHLNWKL